MSYKSTHTGAQIDAGVSAALNPDTTVTPSSTNLVTSGAVAAAITNANAASIAPAFSSSTPYVIGDLVLYEGVAYRFTAAHTGAWDAGDVEQTTLGEEAMDLDAAKADKTDVATADAALEQMIYSVYPTDSITDAAVASFPDGADDIPVRDLTVDLPLTRSGSGTPSPDNVREIVGRSAVTISQSGEDTSDPETVTIQLGQTVYGGTLDVTTGVLTVTLGIVDLSTRSWTYNASYGYIDGNALAGVKAPATNNDVVVGGAEKYGLTSRSTITDTHHYGTNLIAVGSNGKILVSSGATTPTGKFAYELASAQIVQLTPTTVATLIGTNSIWADCGDVASLTYRADPTLYIDKKLAEAANA